MKIKTKETCPIPITHKRLNHVLSIFDDINKSYQNPDKFTSDLNNLIQTLRNVTFMLQSEKHKIENFDIWYKPIQNSMKENDAIDLITFIEMLLKFIYEFPSKIPPEQSSQKPE